MSTPSTCGRNNERRGLVIGIGRARANRGDERFAAAADQSVPSHSRPRSEKRHDRIAARHGAIENNMRIDPHKLPVMIAVAVARSGSSRLDVAQHRASIAADGVVSHARSRPWHLSGNENCRAHAVRRSGNFADANADRHRESHSESRARSESLPARRFLSRQTARSTTDLRSGSIPPAGYRRPMGIR